MLESCAYLYIITQMDKHYNISDITQSRCRPDGSANDAVCTEEWNGPGLC